MRYKQLLAQRAALLAEGETLDAKGELSEEEQTRFTALLAELDALKQPIAEAEAFREQQRAAPAAQTVTTAATTAATPATPTITHVHSNWVPTLDPDEDKAPTPFKSLGEQLVAVATSTINKESGHPVDARLLEINAALGANEAIPSEGGFLVQTDFQPGLLQRIWETGVLFKRTDNTTVGPNSNGLKINAIDETSRATGSRWGGIRGYWLAEAATKTASKPTYRQMELSLQKLAAVYYATDELLQDTTALEQEVAKSFMGELAFLVDDSLIRGTGAGQPLGILNSAGTIQVAATVGQDADSVIAENIWDMFYRMHPASVSNSAWFINHEVLRHLQTLNAVVGVGGVPLFQPAGGIAAAPLGTLLGRPIISIEHASAPGDVGDIIFADWQAYKTISKGGVQTASSIHVAFLTDETAFRWVLRVDGQPKFNAPLTPYKGTNTLSSFITLAAR